AYDPDRDLTPIAALGTTPHILAINSRVPANNLPEFIAYAKANPGKISYASIGFGTIGHLCAALFAARAGIDLVHVPYKGTVQANTDLLTGQVDMLFSNVDILQFIGRNELRMIGVSTAQRIPEL